MRIWRTILSSFLLLAFAAPILFLSLLQLKQLYIKHGMEERLETSLLKTVFVPKEKLQRLNQNELLIEGKLFDVKGLQAAKNGFLVTGIFDDEETAVVQQLDKSCSTNAAKDTHLFAQFFQLLYGLFFQATATQPALTATINKLFQNLILHLPEFYKTVLSPPPQSFC